MTDNASSLRMGFNLKKRELRDVIKLSYDLPVDDISSIVGGLNDRPRHDL